MKKYNIELDTLKIRIDFETPAANNQYNYYSKVIRFDRLLCIIFNQLKYRFQFYNFETLEKEFYINISEILFPNGINQITDPNSFFFVHNLDSIYFLSSNLKTLYLIDNHL